MTPWAQLPRCQEPGCKRRAQGARCAIHGGGRSGRRMPTDWNSTRRRILERDEHRCRLCGAPASTVDHIDEVRHGGSDDDENLQALCRSCHNRKTSALRARR